MGGKGGGGSTTIGYNYFASFAGVAGLGMASELLEVIVEGKSVWKPDTPVQRGTGHRYNFDIEGRGSCYFYWGRPDQELSDPVLGESDPSDELWVARGHPCYRNRPILVFHDFFCGFERLSVPSIQVVYRREADQVIVSSTLGELDDGQANPMAILAEMFTSELTGAGISGAWLDSASWSDVAAELEAEKETEYLSALISERAPLLDLVEQINGYASTYFRFDDSGRIAAGRFQVFGDEPANLPVLRTHDFVDTPTILSVDQTAIDDRFELEFVNRENAYNDAIARYDTPIGREFKQTDSVGSISADWITRPDQAAVKVAQIGEREATPYDNIRVSVREQVMQARGLDVGSQFIIEMPELGYRSVCRIVEISGYSDSGGPVECEIETERLLGPSVASGGFETSTSEIVESPGDLNYFAILQAPEALANGQPYNLFSLAGRTQRAVRGYDLWWRRSGSTAFNLIGYVASFAVPLRLVGDLLASAPDDDETGLIRVREFTTNTPLGFENIPGTQTPEEIADDNLLMVIVSVTDPQHFEILTVKSIESPIIDDYPIWALRGRLGSVKRDHLDGATAWLVFRSQIQLFSNGGFEQIALQSNASARTINVKPQPSTATETLELDIASTYGLELFEQFTEVIYDGNG